MKRIIGTALVATLAAAAGAALPAHAQDQETRQIECRSGQGLRQNCDAGGEVINAAITTVSGETPCIFGYTWGLEEKGVWVGNGCSATFDIAVITERQKREATPEQMRERLRKTRRTVRKLRGDLEREREERQRIEAELVEAQVALAEIDQRRANRSKRKPDRMVSAVSACSRKAVREIEKAGGARGRVAEILSARSTQGAWLIIGRSIGNYGDDRRPGYFRCWVDQGKVRSFDNSI